MVTKIGKFQEKIVYNSACMRYHQDSSTK